MIQAHGCSKHTEMEEGGGVGKKEIDHTYINSMCFVRVFPLIFLISSQSFYVWDPVPGYFFL